MNLLIASILLLFVTYPQSPVLFLVFGLYNMEIYLLFSMLLLFFIFLKNPKLYSGNVVCKKIFIAYALVYAAGLIMSKNITAVRDFLTVALLLIMIIGFRKHLFINIIRKYVLLNSVFLLIAIITTLAFYFIGFDDWEVSKLLMVSENSPVYVRNEWGDFHYFMPLYLTLITVSDTVAEIAFGITFERMPLLYIEPSSLWVYTLGLFFYAFGDHKLPFRPLVLSIFLVALVVSLSVYGVLVLFCVCLFYLYSRSSFLRRNYNIALLMVVSSMVFVYFNPFLLEGILLIIGGNKYEQYLYFADKIDLKQAFTLFGVGEGESTEHRNYGVLGVFVRYGLFGAVVYMCIWFLILMRTLAVCKHITHASKSTIYYSMAVISTLLLYMKSPQMNLMLPIMFLAALEIQKSPNSPQGRASPLKKQMLGVSE